MFWINLIGYLASVLMFSTFYMKKMIPLRAVGASANVTFIIYASILNIYPLLILHAVLLPLNITRMIQMMRLVKKVQDTARGDFSFEFLVPFMTKENFKKGEPVCKKGEESNKLYYLQKGLVKIEGAGIYVTEGELIGEIGIFSQNKQRTDTITCETDSTLYTMPEKQILQLYYQNPKFGFYLVQLIIKRLMKNLNAARQISSMITDEGKDDRRRTERLDLKVSVVVSGADMRGEGFVETGFLENISSEGALLKLNKAINQEAGLGIIIDPSNSNLKVSSKVIWSEQDGETRKYGIVFNRKTAPAFAGGGMNI